MVEHRMPNGEIVPVPPDIVSQGRGPEQAFYDTQLARLAVEAVPAPAPAVQVDGESN